MTYGNLIKINPSISQPEHTGLTIEYNDDKTGVIINGTYTGPADHAGFWFIYPGYISFPFATILTGIPNSSLDTCWWGGGNIGMRLDGYEIPANRLFTLGFNMQKNVLFEDFEVKPMLRPAFISDDTFNPYSMRVQDLTKYVTWIHLGKYFLTETRTQGDEEGVNFHDIILPNNVIEIFIHIGYANNQQVYGGSSMYIIDKSHPYIWSATAIRRSEDHNTPDWNCYAYFRNRYIDDTYKNALLIYLADNYCSEPSAWNIFCKCKL